MKRIEFIAPVAAMRGNISGKQDIVYPTNDNRAWDAPSDKREYARNYQPRFIGAKVAKNGKTYFAVRTKTAVNMTGAVRTQQAILSVSSVIADIVRKDAALINQLQALFMANHPEGWSYKRWLMSNIKSGLAQKKTIVFPGYESLAAVYVKNPYINTTQPSSAVDISEYFPTELLVKFWMQLANNPVTFNAGTYKGIAHAGDTFSEDFLTSELNTIPLGVAVVEGTSTAIAIKTWSGSEIPDEYQVLNRNGSIVERNDTILAGEYEIVTMAHAD